MRLIIAFIFLFGLSASAQKVKVACIGNSITAGYLLANPQQNAYPAQLQSLLGDTYEVGNFGLSGATLLKKGHRPYVNTKAFIDVLNFDITVYTILYYTIIQMGEGGILSRKFQGEGGVTSKPICKTINSHPFSTCVPPNKTLFQNCTTKHKIAPKFTP